jgi:replicative DNA helicase
MTEELPNSIDNEAKNIADLVAEHLKQIKEGTHPDAIIRTGFDHLDKLIGGLRQGEFVVIGGRPSMGKTQFLINLSLHISTTIPVLYITFDLSEFLLTSRFISSVSGIPTHKILEHDFNTQQKEILSNINKEFSKRQLFIQDSGNHSISAVKAHCQKQILEKGVKVIILDYLQFINSTNFRNYRERDLELNNICVELKNMAKESGVCMVVSSQLNRAVETRGGWKRPQLSDLRESGAIEQHADKVLFIHRPEYYGITQDCEGNSIIGTVEILVAKNRIGRLGECCLRVDEDFTNFRNHSDEFSFSPARLCEIEDLPI